MITAGADPLLACIVAFIAGSLAGCITGILNVKLKITDLLSGILVMTAMWSVNLAITKGSAVLLLQQKHHIQHRTCTDTARISSEIQSTYSCRINDAYC